MRDIYTCKVFLFISDGHRRKVEESHEFSTALHAVNTIHILTSTHQTFYLVCTYL